MNIFISSSSVLLLSETIVLLASWPNRNFLKIEVIGVFPKCSRIFVEFSEFIESRKSDNSLKHELSSI